MTPALAAYLSIGMVVAVLLAVSLRADNDDRHPPRMYPPEMLLTLLVFAVLFWPITFMVRPPE